MNYRITELLDGLEEAGQPLRPRGGDAARVRERTLEKLHAAQPLPREQVLSVPRRRTRPLAALIAAAMAVLLLCGSVFAAWKLGAFRFTDEFGPAADSLDAYAQTYESNEAEAIPAAYGYASWVKAQAGDYNLVLLELTASDGQLHAKVDISPRREGLPLYRDSGLTLVFADYETVSTPPRKEGLRDRVELFAALPAPLAADAEIGFSLSGPGAEPARTSFRLDALDRAWEEMASTDRVHYATSAETKDYRFTLRSLTASASTIYAVLDMEALTDYGRSHLDQVPEFAVDNRSRQNSGSLLDARLLEEGEGVRRYLVGFLGSQPLNEAGDRISFEILELFEEGDLAGHPYYLFDVKLESLIPDAVEVTAPQGEPERWVSWQRLSVDAIGLTVEGLGEPRDDGSRPRVELLFRDGSRETVMDADWRPGVTRSAHDAILESSTGWTRDSAWTDHLSLIFAAPLNVSELAAVTVDGQTFPLND